MTQSEEENPCCNQRGTLIITIEPCNRGKDEATDNENKQIVSVLPDEYDIPGLSPKTPRTMDIEIKIRGKDQQLFSDEMIHPKGDGSVFRNKHHEKRVKELPMITLTSEDKSEETFSELELMSHNLEPDDMKSAKVQTQMLQKRRYSSDSSESSESMSIEKRICPKTCPGKLICTAKKHFMGDKCKLHDPTDIGKQILEMHKNGKIRKISANIDKNLYPNFLLCTLSEIKKMQQKAKEEQKLQEGKSGSDSIHDSSEYDINDLSTKDESSSDDTKEKLEKPVRPEKPVGKEHLAKVMKPRTASGCLC